MDMNEHKPKTNPWNGVGQWQCSRGEVSVTMRVGTVREWQNRYIFNFQDEAESLFLYAGPTLDVGY